MSKDYSPTSKFPKDSHLTEFYPYLNGSMQTTPPPQAPTRRDSFSTSNSTYTSFSPSLLSYNNLISKAEIEGTIDSFNELLESSDEYRDALNTLVQASNKFASSLESIAKLKGLENSDGYLSASGLFYLIGNHQQIISENLKTSFELPLQKEIQFLNTKLDENDASFKANYKSLLNILKAQELENIKISRLKKRNLLSYKHNLLQLTSNIDEIDKLKHEYYSKSQNLVNQVSSTVLSNLSSSIRAQVEIYEGIARKGWSGNGLDDLISQGLDPFINEEDEEEDQQNEEPNDANHDTITQEDIDDATSTINTNNSSNNEHYHNAETSLHSHINKNGLTYNSGHSNQSKMLPVLPILTPTLDIHQHNHFANPVPDDYDTTTDVALISSTPVENKEKKFSTIASQESEEYFRTDSIINNSKLGNISVKSNHSEMLENNWGDKYIDRSMNKTGTNEHEEEVEEEADDDDGDNNSFSLPMLGSKDN